MRIGTRLVQAKPGESTTTVCQHGGRPDPIGTRAPGVWDLFGRNLERVACRWTRYEQQYVDRLLSGGSMNKQDTPGVIAPPPLIYLAALVIGVALHYLAPTPFIPRGFAYWLGAALILIGMWIVMSGRQVMLKAGTAIRPTVPTTSLVTVGPFRFTRNPLYVGTTLSYLGIALVFQSLWALALLIVVLAVMQRGVIEREERYL